MKVITAIWNVIVSVIMAITLVATGFILAKGLDGNLFLTDSRTENTIATSALGYSSQKLTVFGSDYYICYK